MPNENEAQPQKKSNLRKPGSPKITGKRVQFDEANLRANREAEATKRLKSWEQKHPNIKDEYLAAGPGERKQLIALYATIQLYSHSDETAQNGFWDRVEDQLFSKDSQAMFSKLAEKANNWETCKEFLQDPGFLGVIEKKGVGWEAAVGKQLDEIPQRPAEKEMQTANALTDAFHKKHPDPQKEYYKKSLDERTEMLQEYLLPFLLRKEPGQDAETLKENMRKVDGDIILSSIARRVQNWEVCKDLLADEELQYHAAHPDVKQEHGDKFLDCAARLTENIQDNPKEQAFLDTLYKPELARQNIETVRKTADTLFAEIEKVDFNLLGSGSREFDAMKKSVKEFRRFAQEEYHLNRNDEVSPELQKELLKKTQESLLSVKKYLDYKQEQFDKDPARRNASGRQKHEQPRILTSIKLFEDLSKLHFEQSMTEPGREHKETRNDLVRKSEFSGSLHSAKLMYTINLASRQSKEKMDKQPLFNDQDKREAAKELAKQKKAEVPKGAKK